MPLTDGDTVDHEALRKAGLAKGPADGVRILGTGELTKKLTVRAHHFSKSAAEKIAAKGGTAEVIPPPKKPEAQQDEAAAGQGRLTCIETTGRLSTATRDHRLPDHGYPGAIAALHPSQGRWGPIT